MKDTLAHYFAPDDAAIVAWFLRDEPLWKLLYARWKLRRQSAVGKRHLTQVALSRIRVGQDRERQKKQKRK